jgi:hypothetical protein
VNPADAKFVESLEAELSSLAAEQDKSGPLGRLGRTKVVTDRVPLYARWWVPYVCVAGIVGVWIPDKYKVRALFYIDETHDAVKLRVHTWYWWATMPPEKYAVLMEQLAANVPKSERIPSADCPL